MLYDSMCGEGCDAMVMVAFDSRDDSRLENTYLTNTPNLGLIGYPPRKLSFQYLLTRSSPL